MSLKDRIKGWFGKGPQKENRAEKAWEKTKETAGEVKEKVEHKVEDLRHRDDDKS